MCSLLASGGIVCGTKTKDERVEMWTWMRGLTQSTCKHDRSVRARRAHNNHYKNAYHIRSNLVSGSKAYKGVYLLGARPYLLLVSKQYWNEVPDAEVRPVNRSELYLNILACLGCQGRLAL